MGFFRKSPEEIEAAETKKQQELERMQIEAELQSPYGQAKLARENGAKTYQISYPLSQTVGTKGYFFGGSAKTEATEHSSLIDSIEAAGWKLEHANYVYQITRTVASKSILSGANQGSDYAYDAEIIGIYIFRVIE